MSDFSCYVKIINQSVHDLNLTVDVDMGGWVSLIPPVVPANTRTEFLQLEDPSGPRGSAGSFTLESQDAKFSVRGKFADPYSGNNIATMDSAGLTPTMSWSFEGTSGGDPGPFEPNGVPNSGHPVYLIYTFTDTAPE